MKPTKKGPVKTTPHKARFLRSVSHLLLLVVIDCLLHDQIAFAFYHMAGHRHGFLVVVDDDRLSAFVYSLIYPVRQNPVLNDELVLNIGKYCIGLFIHRGGILKPIPVIG